VNDLTNNNSEEDIKKFKPCKNGCGKSIYWNMNEKTYFEIDSHQKHVCPNWKPFIAKSQDQLLHSGINIVDTRQETLAEIVLKLDRLERKVDGLKDSLAIGYGEH
jgi:hypothetical protein